MILFFDTSALVKFFHREAGTDVVVSLITDGENRVWLSELAKLEFSCAVHRRYRMKEIEEDQLGKALDGFSSECARFNIVSSSGGREKIFCLVKGKDLVGLMWGSFFRF